MAKKIIKVVRKICVAFVSVYGLNLILGTLNIFIPINIITISIVSILGVPGLISLVITYFLI